MSEHLAEVTNGKSWNVKQIWGVVIMKLWVQIEDNRCLGVMPEDTEFDTTGFKLMEVPDNWNDYPIDCWVFNGEAWSYDKRDIYVVEEVNSLKDKLKETDYISAKMNDSIAQCKSITDLLEVFSTFRSKYNKIIEQRQEWRDRINEIEG